jgi:isopentenyl diphosphate isomerase/L-lactate dehydrogenase-like FMN-dependent dehydrogenase
MGLAADIAALEAAARDAVPGDVLDYYAGGSGTEVTLDEAAAAWLAYRFAPAVLRAVPDADPSVTLFGTRLPSPVAIAPMAFQTLLHPDGEVATAAGAEDALLVVSTRASRTFETSAPPGRGRGGCRSTPCATARSPTRWSTTPSPPARRPSSSPATRRM